VGERERPTIDDQRRTLLAQRGFDLIQPFAAWWYNDAVAAEHRLPDFGRARALGVLIGNTRLLWAPFIAAWRADAALRADPHPIDRYTESRLGPLLQVAGVGCAVRFAHEPAPRRIAIQRLADVSGLARLSRVGLNVHPVFGPWIGLRAAVVFDVDGPAGAPPEAADPCADCRRTCGPAFERARAAPGADTDPADAWRLWLAVRDACPVGRAHRYGEDQIHYHYTKDRAVLP